MVQFVVDPLPHPPDPNRQIFGNNNPSLRVYQVWKGNNKFFLGGRIVFGPDVRSLFLTLFLILFPVILFSAFISRPLIKELPHHLGGLLIAVCYIFTTYDIFLLFLTSGSDPGIVPRNAHPPDEGDGSSVSADWPGNPRRPSRLPPIKDVIVNGMRVRVKYCQTCMLYRPPRCSHCSICNNCVERFDHHCPWVGQCIGKRNYRFFFMFVSSTTILCAYVFALCWVNVGKYMAIHHCGLWNAFRHSPVSLILILYTFVIAWFVGGLTSFHFYLISTNQTTYENFRYWYDRKRSPYNRGCARNVGEVFFSKIPRSRNHFRAKVNEGSFPVSPTSSSLAQDTSSEVKMNIDIETGERQGVAAKDIQNVHSQIDIDAELNMGATQPGHTNGDHNQPSDQP